MNLSLLDPFQGDLPGVIEEYLDHGIAKCIAFNRRGTLLAAGCSDGSCVIWDFDTRGIAKKLQLPESNASITSVSWSKSGHKLLAANGDCSLNLWDIASGKQIVATTFKAIVLHARLQPGNDDRCLACPVASAPMLVELSSGEKYPLPVSSTKEGEVGHSGRSKNSESATITAPVAATFNKAGDLIYIGTARAEILIVRTEDRLLLGSLQIPGGACIKQLNFSRNGRFLLANSSDRVIRVYEIMLPQPAAQRNGHEEQMAEASHVREDPPVQDPALKFVKEYHDAVNRMQWKSACFSGDSEYVVAAAQIRGEHKIHIWSRGFGQLARILEGPKEAVIDLAWHPTRPIAASVSHLGLVYLWAKDYVENWSAFAPDFKELEENEEYVEREDEFDINPEEDKVKPEKSGSESPDVDIETVEKIAAFSDSDDSEQGLYFLPIAPEPDERAGQAEGEEGGEVEGPATREGGSGEGEETSPPQGQAENDSQRTSTAGEDSGPGPGGEDEAKQNSGRQGRKRRLSEKAAELEAERQKTGKKGRNGSGGKKGNQQASAAGAGSQKT